MCGAKTLVCRIELHSSLCCAYSTDKALHFRCTWCPEVSVGEGMTGRQLVGKEQVCVCVLVLPGCDNLALPNTAGCSVGLWSASAVCRCIAACISLPLIQHVSARTNKELRRFTIQNSLVEPTHRRTVAYTKFKLCGAFFPPLLKAHLQSIYLLTTTIDHQVNGGQGNAYI